MKRKRNLIKEYFQSWITNDPKCIENMFDNNVVYIECYGPIYKGKEQILKWFNNWNKKGKVLIWDIKDIKKKDSKYFVEWYFKCRYEGNENGFDGISIIEFNKNNKIKSVKEFQSKAEHYYPYE